MSQQYRPWKVLAEKNFDMFCVSLLVSSLGAPGALFVGGLLSLAVVAGAAFTVPAIKIFEPEKIKE